jgi:hypothetical protein
MGLKRKASFEDSSLSSPSPQSMLPSSQSSSTYKSTSSGDHPLNLWNITGAPYCNSRTRKRFRDGRPDKETIHQNTLNMLFNAQKQSHSGGTAVHCRGRIVACLTSEVAPTPSFHPSCEPISGLANLVEIPRERNQRSLDGFFGPWISHRRRNDDSLQVECLAQAPLPSVIYQSQESVPHLIPPHPRTLPSVLTCEDCDAPLFAKLSGEVVDAEMLDIDGPSYMDPEIDDGWSCSMCAKRVCDVCAVRGNFRVCLECAVPGGGRYRQEEIHEKRWVGGIGWM